MNIEHITVIRGFAVTTYIKNGKYSCKIGNGFYNWDCDKALFDVKLHLRLTEIASQSIKNEIKEIHKVIKKLSK